MSQKPTRTLKSKDTPNSIKQKFKWAIPLTENEIESIWNNAILTVDTNVLLDLYRYHPNTRESILDSIAIFKQRLWLSNQAITEFFSNRNKVIADSRNAFKDGIQVMGDLSNLLCNEIDKLINNNRTISKELVKNIKSQLASSINELVKGELEKKNEVSYKDDQILEKIISLFNNNIGEGFNNEEYKNLVTQAEERYKNKIPPGYKDNDKGGERQYGDFILWKEILKHGKSINKPIIFITSDGKEDWWEINHGETAGPRNELKKEAWDEMNNHILIYKTESFLSHINDSRYIKNQNAVSNTNLNDAIEEVTQLGIEKRNIVDNVEQYVIISNERENKGIIKCSITRSTPYFTVSGQLSPQFDKVPNNIEVELVSSPFNGFIPPTIISKTGTTHDFNIHMKSNERCIFQPGDYEFNYHAYIKPENNNA